MQHHHEDRELDAAIARFLARQADQTNQPTAEELREVALSFPSTFYVVVLESEGKRLRMAEALVCVGVLERNETRFPHNGGIAKLVEFRRRGCQIVQVAA